MESDDRYIKASRYDLKAQSHNRRVFHRELVARPWRALACAIGMSIVGVNAVLGQVDAPRWNGIPWMVWLFAGFVSLFVGYFLACAVLGWKIRYLSSNNEKSER
jgi:hypothetical protein